jgi:serum/glucocorticoid-regulated kinase 2
LNQLEPGIKNEQVAKFYLSEIIIALEFIHSQGIIYRDLKPENILIDIDGHIKITDFGLAKQLKNRDDLSSTFCGSPEYLCPEMLQGKKHSRAVDFYTLGCLAYELLIGIPPYYSEDRQEMSRDIMYGELYIPNAISEDAKDLLLWLLQRDPTKRPREFSQVK